MLVMFLEEVASKIESEIVSVKGVIRGGSVLAVFEDDVVDGAPMGKTTPLVEFDHFRG